LLQRSEWGALTYAQRYALFTLVGIAGEDDLDAPDLGTVSKAGVELPDGDGGHANRPSRDGGKFPVASARPVFAPDQSAILRDQLVAELVAIIRPVTRPPGRIGICLPRTA